MSEIIDKVKEKAKDVKMHLLTLQKMLQIRQKIL